MIDDSNPGRRGPESACHVRDVPHAFRGSRLGKAALALLALAAVHGAPALGEPIRHPLPNGATFPIAQAVEVPAGETIVFVSGTTPTPAARTSSTIRRRPSSAPVRSSSESSSSWL